MHKADVCINHTIGTKYGCRNVEIQRGLCKMASIPKGKNSLSFDKLLSYLDPPTSNDDPVETFFAANIQMHSTIIASFIKDSKRYVWYNNPWGFHSDAGYHQDIDEQNLAWWEDFKDNSVEDLKRQKLTIADGPPYTYSDLFFLNADRVRKYMVDKMDKDQLREVMKQYDSWNKPVKTSSYHPMSILYYLKLLSNADHLEVLHPSDTMPGYGPQRGDGIDNDLPGTSTPSGACSLWASMYAAKVHDVIGVRLKNIEEEISRRDVNTLLHHVKTTLASKSLHGKVENDISKRSAIAHGVDDREYSMKALLAMVYDVIPEKNVVETLRKRKRTNISTGWHDKVFHKLDTLLRIEEREYNKVHGKKKGGPEDGRREHDRFKVDAEHEDKIIAGYIETLAIISGEDETNKGLTYLDKTGHVAAFVVRNRLGFFQDLEDFVDTTKFLISCKHNDDPENAEVSRNTYESSVPTRLVRERHDRILRDTHPKLFGYNLPDRQREIGNNNVIL